MTIKEARQIHDRSSQEEQEQFARLIMRYLSLSPEEKEKMLAKLQELIKRRN